MSTNPLGSPRSRWLDSNGNPLSGGLLYSYAAGTSTPQSTYTTRAGSVANANPVVLDANGEASVWLTPGVDYKFELRNSAGALQWTEDNFPSPAEADASSDSVVADAGGRLTLTSLTPVTTSDVTGGTTVFYSPYKSNKVPLYDGTNWALHSITSELSQTTADTTKSPAAVAVSSNYDLFVWSDSGTLRLSRGPAWTSDTGRGTGAATTELERVDGRYVNKVSVSNGPGAQRGLYVGTVRSDGSAQINDSKLKRHVWNMYNRVTRFMFATDTTDAWAYNTDAFRQANATAANQLDFVRGLDEDAARATVAGMMANSAAAIATGSVGVGLDSTTVNSASLRGRISIQASNPSPFLLHAFYDGLPGLGRHTLVWLERATGSAGLVNFYGDLGDSTQWQSGISGTMLA